MASLASRQLLSTSALSWCDLSSQKLKRLRKAGKEIAEDQDCELVMKIGPFTVLRKGKPLLGKSMVDDRPLLFNEAVNFDREAIFIAVPKTGTTSIRRQLRMQGPKLIPNPHLTIRQVRDGLYTYLLKQSLGGNAEFPTKAAVVLSDDEIREKAADIFKRYFKFASLRNPWARVVSLYKRREGVRVSDRMEFEVFCEGLKYASDTCSHPTRAISQLDWMTDENGELLVDFVLRLEEHAAGLEEINARTAGRLGLEEMHLNSNPNSNASSCRSMYSDKTRKLVEEACRRDIEYFGYEF